MDTTYRSASPGSCFCIRQGGLEEPLDTGMSRLAGSIGSRLWSGYNTALVTNPLLTKSFTSFTGFILGDGIAQLATKGPERYDYARTARFAAFGFCIHAPGCHYFYKALDSVVFPHAAKRCVLPVFKQLL